MISKFFITRPIFACVISAFIVIAGLGGMISLPISAYPDIIPPSVTVAATYPGATAETIASTVAAPLEKEINGVEGMLYMSSVNSGNGTLMITVTFNIGTDPDMNAVNVNNRIQAAVPRLPEEVRRQGVVVRKASTTFLQIVSVHSPDNSVDMLTLSSYVTLNVVDELRRIPGIGDVMMWGQDYSIRIWMQPDKLAQLGLTPSDVAAAVRQQNSQYAAGQVGVEPVSEQVDFTYAVTAQGRLQEPEEFEQIVVHTTEAGGIVRLKDVARVELGAQMYNNQATIDGQRAVMMALVLQPGANALETGNAVQERLAELSKDFPKGMAYSIPYDTIQYVKVSIKEVVKTLLEAMVLVFFVVLLFLQNWRATIIPMLAVPVSLVGTFAAMHLFGFSINMLTLFGMVLAIGIVVDDAIVVLENVERIMTTENLPAPQATEKAMEEVTRPVIAIVLVLTAVFLPVAFLGGLVGEMYKQFAVTISVSVVISGFVALTLTPALCALLLKHDHVVQNRFLLGFNNWFQRVTHRYENGVRFVMKRAAMAAGIFVVMIVAVVGLFRALPTSLAPSEDQGYVFVIGFLQDAASLDRTVKSIETVAGEVRNHPAVANAVAVSGMDPLTQAMKTNSGIIWLPMKPWDERKSDDLSPSALVGAVFGAGAKIKDGFFFAVEPPPIEGLSMTGGFEAYIQSRGSGSIKDLEAVTQKLVGEANKRPELAGTQTTFSASVPQMRIDLDREKAMTLGVDVGQVFETLQSTFGALYVNDFNRNGRVYQVQLQSEPRFRAYPEDIRNVYVRSNRGELVPLTALASIREVTGAEIVERFNAFTAAKVMGGAAPGYSSGDALRAIEEVAEQTLPQGYALAFTGTAYQEKVSGGASQGVYLLGVLMVFLILAAQFERWTLPVAVILAVPFAAFGAFLAVYARGLANDIYFQIGMLTLIGLAAKNAILIVEFALMKYHEGMGLMDAAIEGAKLRFRPIIMTSLALIFGVLPLAISTGAGANSRHSLGTSVIGGMLAATFIATLFVPLFFKWIAGAKGGEAYDDEHGKGKPHGGVEPKPAAPRESN
ncbi:MAG TPA: multidrug efflux RND transporter permease subunit [Steroidobacter sp.]|uniref:efflux RND transporter permease subunit n=1 Tax=Steroidobacter sp. TaxID=1978227 RepID=UPI002ED9EE01